MYHNNNSTMNKKFNI